MLFDEEEKEKFCQNFKQQNLSDEEKITMIVEMCSQLNWGVSLNDENPDDEIVGMLIGTQEFIKNYISFDSENG